MIKMEDNIPNLFIKDEENDLFFFETDHLALKGNKDYCEILKTLVILSAQREKAIKDYNKIVEIRKRSLEDPLATLENIQNGDDLGIPARIELPRIPVIDFEKFDVKVSEADLKTVYSDVQEKSEECRSMKISNNNQNVGAWTPEEQRRLEELLVIYPSEPVEMRRFQKIAAALGNRSVQQVTSRVQKYFIKLFKAGLPIPGRIPKSIERYKCDYCNVEPITGVRWHCVTCFHSIDFCTDCVLSQMYSNEAHPLSHRLVKFYNDNENSSNVFSDSDSPSESAVTSKNYETDSNCSGDFESSSILESLTHENSNCDVSLEQDDDSKDFPFEEEN